MLRPKNAKKFKKDIKRFENQKVVMNELKQVIKSLLSEEPLDEKYCDHVLTGNWVGHRECHIKPDVLLIYKIGVDTLFLERFGSHSELFS